MEMVRDPIFTSPWLPYLTHALTLKTLRLPLKKCLCASHEIGTAFFYTMLTNFTLQRVGVHIFTRSSNMWVQNVIQASGFFWLVSLVAKSACYPRNIRSSVRLYICAHVSARVPWRGFPLNLILGLSCKSVENIQIWLKSGNISVTLRKELSTFHCYRQN
jgi:hypothetical protein